jgi:N-acetylmuramoyl-L-alanine amidase
VVTFFVVPTVHTVAAGDCLYSIGKLYRFPTWETIYDAPDNEDFKKARPDPNVIYPGDQLVIPDLEPSTKSVACGTDLNHKFQVKLPHFLFRVKVKDEDDKPITGKKFRLEIGDDQFDGTTDGDGIVQQRIPVDQTSARLWVFFTSDEENGENLMWDVGIGYLDPSDTLEGVKERLNNLGFVCGDPDGQWHDGMDVPVRTFQKAAGVDPTGTVDDGTASQLKDANGKV